MEQTKICFHQINQIFQKAYVRHFPHVVYTFLSQCVPDLVHAADRSIEVGSKISAKKPFHLKRIRDWIQLFEK